MRNKLHDSPPEAFEILNGRVYDNQGNREHRWLLRTIAPSGEMIFRQI